LVKSALSEGAHGRHSGFPKKPRKGHAGETIEGTVMTHEDEVWSEQKTITETRGPGEKISKRLILPGDADEE